MHLLILWNQWPQQSCLAWYHQALYLSKIKQSDSQQYKRIPWYVQGQTRSSWVKFSESELSCRNQAHLVSEGLARLTTTCMLHKQPCHHTSDLMFHLSYVCPCFSSQARKSSSTFTAVEDQHWVKEFNGQVI